MKTYTAHVTVTLRKAILDVQGKTVEQALHSMQMPSLGNIRIGKHIELEVQAADNAAAMSMVDEACRKLLSNPVMEDYSVRLVEGA